jgi:hypothetical protein
MEVWHVLVNRLPPPRDHYGALLLIRLVPHYPPNFRSEVGGPAAAGDSPVKVAVLELRTRAAH